MEIINVPFDGKQGELEVDIEKGTLKVTVKEGNPSFPAGAQVSVPLDGIFQKFVDKQTNIFAKWGLKILLGILDAL